MRADDSRGAASILGILLLVAVVVVAGMAVALSSFSFTSSLYEPKQTVVNVEQNGLGGNVEQSATLTFTMKAGNVIDVDDLYVSVDGTVASGSPVDVRYPNGSFGPDDSVVVMQSSGTDLIGGEKIALVYHADDHTKTLAKTTFEPGGLSAQSPYFVFVPYESGTQPGPPWSVTENEGCLGAAAAIRSTYASIGEKRCTLNRIHPRTASPVAPLPPRPRSKSIFRAYPPSRSTITPATQTSDY